MTKRLRAAGMLTLTTLLITTLGGVAFAAAAPDSKRLERAKDYIADEQWTRAIVELQAVAEDPKETNRDEALFWLAHSEHQSGDDSAALQTIAKLETHYPKSRWVRIAGSMRVEIAQRLRRDDLLWMMVSPPTPRAASSPAPVIAPPTQPPPPAVPWTRPPRQPSAAPRARAAHGGSDTGGHGPAAPNDAAGHAPGALPRSSAAPAAGGGSDAAADRVLGPGRGLHERRDGPHRSARQPDRGAWRFARSRC